MQRDETDGSQDRDTHADTNTERASQAQPDPRKMQNAPLRPQQDEHAQERGSPNVHMEPGHENEAAATEGERPKFDR